MESRPAAGEKAMASHRLLIKKINSAREVLKEQHHCRFSLEPVLGAGREPKAAAAKP